MKYSKGIETDASRMKWARQCPNSEISDHEV
jgi:hypothetical protein